MPYREKIAWMKLLLHAPFWGVYGWITWLLLSGENVGAFGYGALVLLLAAINWGVPAVASRGVRTVELDAPDEREDLIYLRSIEVGFRAMMTASIVMAIGALLFQNALPPLWADSAHDVIFHGILLLMGIANTAVFAAQVLFFRRPI